MIARRCLSHEYVLALPAWLSGAASAMIYLQRRRSRAAPVGDAEQDARERVRAVEQPVQGGAHVGVPDLPVAVLGRYQRRLAQEFLDGD